MKLNACNIHLNYVCTFYRLIQDVLKRMILFCKAAVEVGPLIFLLYY
jgi:hypothetical protein